MIIDPHVIMDASAMPMIRAANRSVPARSTNDLQLDSRNDPVLFIAVSPLGCIIALSTTGRLIQQG